MSYCKFLRSCSEDDLKVETAVSSDNKYLHLYHYFVITTIYWCTYDGEIYSQFKGNFNLETGNCELETANWKPQSGNWKTN